jgi:hypothetical protein
MDFLMDFAGKYGVLLSKERGQEVEDVFGRELLQQGLNRRVLIEPVQTAAEIK